MTIKSLVLAGRPTTPASYSAEDAAVFQLGVGYALASCAEAAKKQAKADLEKLGLISDVRVPGNYTLLSSRNFILTQQIKLPAARLNEDALKAALKKEGLTQAVRNRIMRAAKVEATPAATYSIVEK